MVLLISGLNSTIGKAMKIQVIKFGMSAETVKIDQDGLELDGPASLELLRKEHSPAAFLVRLSDLAAFRAYDNSVTDRKVKHKAKGLSQLLLGRDKVPLIDGNFSDAGQAGRSASTLLTNARKRAESNVYIIGVRDDIFEELWSKAGMSRQRVDPVKQRSPERHEVQASEGTDMSTWLLRELGRQCPAPPELSRIFVGESEAAIVVRSLIMLAAQTGSPVLILGDTGTGKEVVAREIHNNSNRKDHPFIPVNCGGIPSELLESELFGHKRGAFTDAKFDKRGLWQIAGQGTLFLDEIGELRPDHQAKVLRVLDKGEIRPVGETKAFPVEAQVIAATNRDLFSMVQTQEFREDLYYRLRGLIIRTPSLRDHPQDIPLLAEHLWNKICKESSQHLPQDILDELKLYGWPGNVRELKMVLSNLHTLFGDQTLTAEHLWAVFYLEGQGIAAGSSKVTEREIALHRAQCLRHLKRAYELLHAVQFAMNPLAEKTKIDKAVVRTVQSSLRLRLQELEMLCRYPLFFHSEATFAAAYGFKGKMTYLLSLFQRSAKEAATYWEMEVAETLKDVQSVVFKEIESVLGNA